MMISTIIHGRSHRMARKYYEVLWYVKDTDGNWSDYHWREFSSKKGAFEYYNKHKDDKDKGLWWITYRDVDGSIIYDLLY